MAQLQANTAHRRLKLDLYEQRFNIYPDLLDLYLANMKGELGDIKAMEFLFVRAFQESEFLFVTEDEVYDILNTVKDAQSAISAHGELKGKEAKI